MGTNYYFKPKLHICKMSMGWKPLFESTKYYKNVKELKDFYERNRNRISIADENPEEFTIEDFEKYMAANS